MRKARKRTESRTISNFSTEFRSSKVLLSSCPFFAFFFALNRATSTKSISSSSFEIKMRKVKGNETDQTLLCSCVVYPSRLLHSPPSYSHRRTRQLTDYWQPSTSISNSPSSSRSLPPRRQSRSNPPTQKELPTKKGRGATNLQERDSRRQIVAERDRSITNWRRVSRLVY